MVAPLTVVVQPLDPALLMQLSRLVHKLKHDLSNSLVAAMGELELIASDVDDAPLAEQLQETRGKLLRPFHDLRRMAGGFPLPEQAQTRWQDAQQALSARARSSEVTLVWRPDALTVITAEVAVRPVVVALVTNALDAVSAGGSILVEAISGPRSGLAVSDDGPGCDDLTAAAGGEIARNGSVHLGLGLQIAATILAERGGELAISANVPRGFRAEATWPTP